jgi:hypothetical protein
MSEAQTHEKDEQGIVEDVLEHRSPVAGAVGVAAGSAVLLGGLTPFALAAPALFGLVGYLGLPLVRRLRRPKTNS